MYRVKPILILLLSFAINFLRDCIEIEEGKKHYLLNKYKNGKVFKDTQFNEYVI